MKFGEACHRGYCLLDLTRDRVRNDWFLVPTVEEPTSEQYWAAGILVASGAHHGVRAEGPPAA